MIFQSERSECALACLAMVSAAHGRPTNLRELRQKFPSSLRGATLPQVIHYADLMGFGARALRLEMEQLSRLHLPCILHWDMNHFVVLTDVGRQHVTVMDPGMGVRRWSLAHVSQHFTGVALELTPTPGFKPQSGNTRLSLSSLTGRVRGLARSLSQILLVALVLEMFAAAGPLLNQLVVDEAIATNDLDLLRVLLVGFALLLAIQALLGVARSWLVVALGQAWNLQWSSNVFRHLLKLPVAFFEKRHLGDLMSRFGAVEAIQRTLTLSAIEAVIDGVMGLVALGLMLTYSPALTCVVVGAVLAYGVLRWVVYRPFSDTASERLVASARERTHFLESVRAIVPLKLFGREHQRFARWQNLMVEVQNRDVLSQKMTILFNTANTLILGVENLLVFWMGSGLVMRTSAAGSDVFTVGMMFAFIGFKLQFSTRAFALVDHAVDIKMLGLQAERLADIVLAVPEKEELPRQAIDSLQPCLELKSVSFRYSEGEPWILKDVDLHLHAGESVAIVGPSGSGKTTLLKLLLGLAEPVHGEVLYGGVAVSQYGVRNYRALVGTVMQEDILLDGSIGENISFFDEAHDESRLIECATAAAIHDDICRMPMQYDTLVGDMGSSLSGGQKQRVLLARALYKQPRILVLDEATSHLDVACEKLVTQTLARMPMTRIVVAHRPETIAGAQRVVRLQEGRVSELRSIGTGAAATAAPGME